MEGINPQSFSGALVLVLFNALAVGFAGILAGFVIGKLKARSKRIRDEKKLLTQMENLPIDEKYQLADIAESGTPWKTASEMGKGLNGLIRRGWIIENTLPEEIATKLPKFRLFRLRSDIFPVAVKYAKQLKEYECAEKEKLAKVHEQSGKSKATLRIPDFTNPKASPGQEPPSPPAPPSADK